MRAISLQQPWASLVAIGAKRWETRSWRTGYRGPIAIHASATYPPWCREMTNLPAFYAALRGEGPLPMGSIVALGELAECYQCRPSTAADVEYPESEFGNFEAGRYRFLLANVRRLVKPIPCKGALAVWSVPPELAIRVDALAA